MKNEMFTEEKVRHTHPAEKKEALVEFCFSVVVLLGIMALVALAK